VRQHDFGNIEKLRNEFIRSGILHEMVGQDAGDFFSVYHAQPTRMQVIHQNGQILTFLTKAFITQSKRQA